MRAMNPLSGVLDEAWRMYKSFAKHLLAIAFVIYLGAAIIEGLLALAGTVGFWLGFLVSVVALFLLQATLVKAVQDVRDGRADMSIRETVSAAFPYLGPVAGASILAAVAIWIGLLLLIVPGLFLITIWAVIVPVIVIERSGALASFGRSRALVRGHGWHVFWTLVLVFLIMLAVNIVLGLIFRALPHVLGSGLSAIISGTLISPFLALVVTLVYYRLVGISATTGVGQYAGYQQPAQGGFGQPPQGGDPYGGYQPPPQGGYQPPPQGGYQPPPQGGGYGGYQPPPQGGSEPPTQQIPRSGDWDPPAQPPH
jgi:hypothetical protein